MAPDHSDLHHHHDQTYPSTSPHKPDEPLTVDDLALESAIGDAFQLFGFLDQKPKQEDAGHVHHEESVPEHSGASNAESHEDIDLEAAVGNAFQSFESQFHAETEEQDYQREEYTKQDYPGEEYQKEENQKEECQRGEIQMDEDANKPKDDYTDYFKYTGDHNPSKNSEDIYNEENHFETQKQLPSGNIEATVSEYSNQPLQAEEAESDGEQAELDLEAAIGNAFKSITKHVDSLDNVNFHASEPQDKKKVESIEHELHYGSVSPSHSLEEDDKLENAIGEAFKSLTEHSATPQPESTQKQDELSKLHEAEQMHQLQHDDPQSYEPRCANHSEHHPNAESHGRIQVNTHDNQHLSKQEHDLTVAISASFEDVMGTKEEERRPSDIGFDLAGIVQNVVQQMASDATSSTQEAQASQRLTESVENNKKDIPRLDENVLAHFQMEADKDDDKFEDSSLKDAIANAVKTAMLKRSNEEETSSAERPDQDLEKLQMNEILQNAFSMAMLNPQDLLTSLNDDESSEATSHNQSTLSSAAAIAALSMKDALEKRDVSAQSNKTGTDSSGPRPLKSLSIAETLALHRSSMSNAPRRDYSSIQSLEESIRADPQRAPAMNPQLSNILSSLSHHIQSGNQSQNLMLVIRQMTNALMLNKSSSNVSTAAQDLLQEVKSRPEEQKFFLDSLLASKTFLSNGIISDLRKRALILIDNVIGLLKEKDSGFNGYPATGFETEISESFPEFYDCALSALSGFNNTRLRSILAGIKPDLDSSEYKEKIRIDNRERKKKWREENAERNKDNDLRSRVIKRANNMFGEESTPEKKAWIEEEFNKRREKRLAKQKKEEIEKPIILRGVSEPAETKPLASVYTEDPKLVKRVSDIFSLVAETGLDDDPQTILEATSAATAVAASSYAHALGLTDNKPVQSAVTQILTNVLDSTVRTGTFMRIPFLSKVYNSSRPSFSLLNENKDLMSRLSSLTGAASATGATQKSALEILQSSRKRLGLEFQTSDLKKPRVDQGSALFIEKDKSSISRIESEIDQLRTSISSSTASHLWSSTSGLKMPLYKKPPNAEPKTAGSNIVKNEYPSPGMSKPSPFISNRMGPTNSSAQLHNIGLRKPSSFQRPAYSNTSSKGKSLGFPTLYSPSFRLK